MMAAVASTTIRREFAGRERDFRLAIGELGALERICGAGIGAIAMRLAGHQFYAADIWETIRLGLQGGGLPEIDASATVRILREGPIGNDRVQIASEILMASLSGAEAADASRKGAEVEAGFGDLAALYRIGGMMGLDARRIDALTLGELKAMLDGFSAMHGGGGDTVDRDAYEKILAEEMAAGRA